MRAEFLWDAQTSGGLLISVAPGKAEELLAELHRRGLTASRAVGEVLPPQAEVRLIFRS